MTVSTTDAPKAKKPRAPRKARTPRKPQAAAPPSPGTAPPPAPAPAAAPAGADRPLTMAELPFTHVILRPVTAFVDRVEGELVNATTWRTLSALEHDRRLRRLYYGEDIRPVTCSRPGCGRMFTDRASMARHTHPA